MSAVERHALEDDVLEPDAAEELSGVSVVPVTPQIEIDVRSASDFEILPKFRPPRTHPPVDVSREKTSPHTKPKPVAPKIVPVGAVEMVVLCLDGKGIDGHPETGGIEISGGCGTHTPKTLEIHGTGLGTEADIFGDGIAQWEAGRSPDEEALIKTEEMLPCLRRNARMSEECVRVDPACRADIDGPPQGIDPGFDGNRVTKETGLSPERDTKPLPALQQKGGKGEHVLGGLDRAGGEPRSSACEERPAGESGGRREPQTRVCHPEAAAFGEFPGREVDVPGVEPLVVKRRLESQAGISREGCGEGQLRPFGTGGEPGTGDSGPGPREPKEEKWFRETLYPRLCFKDSLEKILVRRGIRLWRPERPRSRCRSVRRRREADRRSAPGSLR